MYYGLNEEVIDNINRVLTSSSKIESVYIYGSRAKGIHEPGSDIDLAVVAPELSLAELFRIENELDDLLLPWNFDLVLFHQITNPGLIDHIRRVGVLMYKKVD